MGGLGNDFLQDYLSTKSEKFIGVFSVDLIPKNLWKKNCSLIVNLSPSNRKGSHFIAIYIDSANTMWYFDSFALPPPIFNTHLMKCLNKWIGANKFNYVLNHPIQDFESIFCGWYTAAFCLFINHFYPFQFESIFHQKNLRLNEKIVVHLIKNLQKRNK